jgi:amino-acid N-acetyltransferase
MNATVIDEGSATRAHAAGSPAARAVPPAGVVLRDGRTPDAAAILGLIDANLSAGHLLPRSAADVAAHAHRFVVLDEGGRVIGCAELAPLSRAVAEVRSLVVDAGWRGRGLGSRLIDELGARARAAGFTVLCAFTHDPHQFVRLGFSIVPHVWFPEKVALDCTGCAKFRRCGQHAIALSLAGDSVLPTLGRLREPITPAAARGTAAVAASIPPVRLRVIA